MLNDIIRVEVPEDEEPIRVEVPEVVYKGTIPLKETTATPEDVVLGKTFYSNLQAPLTGTLDISKYELRLPEQIKTVKSSVLHQEVEADEGYKLKKVIIDAITADDIENLKPYNIRKGVNVLGLEGTLEPDKPDQKKEITPTEEKQSVLADAGYELTEVTVNAIPKNYIGSEIKRVGGRTITPTTESQIIIDANTYVEGIITLDSIKTESRELKSGSVVQEIVPTDNKYINKITLLPILLENRVVQPQTTTQEITASEGFDGIGKLIIPAVNAEDFYKPEESVNITPTEEIQTKTPEEGKVFNKVIVDAIPNSYMNITKSENIYNGSVEVVE